MVFFLRRLGLKSIPRISFDCIEKWQKYIIIKNAKRNQQLVASHYRQRVVRERPQPFCFLFNHTIF